MTFADVASGVNGSGSVRKRDFIKRRLTSPRSPLLQKLPIGGSESNVRQSCRIKDRREEAIVRQYEKQVNLELKNQQQQYRERYLGRWHHVRHLYAAISEMMTARKETLANRSKVPLVPTTLSTVLTDKPTPAPIHNLTAMAWLIDMAREFRQGFATHHVTMPQVEIAIGAVLHLNLSTARTSTPTANIASCLHSVFQAYKHEPDASTVDYRELLGALFVLDRWREGDKKMVSRWFQEFAFPLVENSTAIGDWKMAVRGADLQRVLFIACGDAMDESKMQPFVTELLEAMDRRGRNYIAEATFWDYSDTHPKLLETIKTLCWKRLTDDTRLTFYRDVYLHAKDRFAKEEARVMLEKAVGLWRTHEPRLRFARWKIFVAHRKLLHRGDSHFRAWTAAKLVKRLKQNCKRRQEMRTLMQMAVKHRGFCLVRLTFQPWALFWRSMLFINVAAWRRSERHERRSCQKRCWHSWIIIYEQAKTRNASRNKAIATFVAMRNRKILRSSLDTWLIYKRRQAEVAAADIRVRQLQYDLLLFQQQETEGALMEIEDSLSAAMEAKARASAEMSRRRTFLDATNRVHVNRKLQKQKEERMQHKISRQRAAELEAKQGWTAIAEQMAVEIRSATLSWLETKSAKDQIHTEATRIFEMDAKWIRNELEHDPDNGPGRVLPKGCQWQVFLEAPHGVVTRKLTKAFYLNTVTYEKHWCDEVAIEDCEVIAREVIIQRRIDDGLDRLKEKEAEWEHQRRQNIYATRIQMMFRCRKARSICRRIIRNTFIKRIDPRSGHVVYFNVDRPQETRRRPPMMIGSDEPLIPVESSSWVYRQNARSSGYYERIDTGESSVGPPDHYILCTRCSVHFVTRRRIVDGARYCIGCYANIRLAQRRTDVIGDEEGGWTKIPVQLANCIVCRNALADFVCTDCNHDATCTRCFGAIHGRLPKNKIHNSPIPLVNRI